MMTGNTRRFELSAYALKLCVRFVSIIALLTSLGDATLAQTAARGVKPLGSYAVSDIETVSLTNGNINLSIPLASLPPIAGGSLQGNRPITSRNRGFYIQDFKQIASIPTSPQSLGLNTSFQCCFLL